MSSQGPRFPGTTANLSNAGSSENTDAWVSPGNVAADDGSEATITAASYDSPDISQILVCSNFGFSIPTGATIDGIVVEIERRNSAGAASDNRVQLAKGTTFASLVGANKADTALDWPTTITLKSYGASNDLWSTTWTPAEINASSFAIFLSAQADAANTDIQVDYIRITIHYSGIVEPGLIQQLGAVFTPTLGVVKFTDDFETGDTSKWDIIVQSSGTITVDSRAHAGSFGMHIDEAAVAAGSGTYARRSMLPSNTIRASGWYRQESEGPAGNNNANIRFFSGGVRIVDLYRQNDTGGLWLRTRNDAGTSIFTRLAADGYASVGVWYKLDVLIEYLGTGAVSHIQAWVDDVEVLDLSNFDLDAGLYDAVSLGPEHPDQYMDTDYDDIRVNDPETGLNVSPGLIQQLGVLFSPKINEQVVIPLITQAGVTFAPSVRQTVHPGLISNLGTVFAFQQLMQQVRPGLLSNLGVVFAPQVNQQVVVGLISNLGTTFSPKVNLWIHPVLISNVGVVFTPDVIADQFVTPGLVQQLGVVFSPQVNQQVRMGLVTNLGVVFSPQMNQWVHASLIQQLGTTFAPKVNQSVHPALIQQLGGVFSPQLNQWIHLGLITQAGAVFAPQLNQQVQIGLITQASTIFAPTVTTPGNNVFPDIITNLGTVFDPRINQQVQATLIQQLGATFDPSVAQAVHPSLLQQLGVVFGPQINQQVRAAFISNLGVTFDPTVQVSGNNIFPPLISQLGVLFDPTIVTEDQFLALDVITQLGTVFSPQINQQVRMGLIPSTVLLFAPSVSMEVEVPLISQLAQIFAPAFLETGVVRPGLVVNLGQVFDPTIIADQIVLVPIITNLGVVFAPGIQIGGLWAWLSPQDDYGLTRDARQTLGLGWGTTKKAR